RIAEEFRVYGKASCIGRFSICSLNCAAGWRALYAHTMLLGMNDWRDLLPDLLHERDLPTQAAIVRALNEALGVTLNQATISRELNALGAVKVEGAYRLPPAPEVGAPIHSFVVTAGGCLVVVKSDPAYASVVGQAIDAARL